MWGCWRGWNREVRLELALTEWVGILWGSISIPGKGNGEHKAHSVSWGDCSGAFLTLRECVHGVRTGWEGGRERMKAQAKESECYSIGSHWRAFRKGEVEMIRYSFKKDCSDSEREAGLEKGGAWVQWRGPPCGLSESWCTLNWAVNEEEAWTQSGQDPCP